jgi:hypothetical protein
VLGLSAKLTCVALSSALLSSTVPGAWLEPVSDALVSFGDEITPDSANAARFGVEQQGRALVDAGAPDQAAELYWTKGVELKDPVLIIDCGEAWRNHAREQRSIESAQAAIDRTAVALDMLYFLRDGATSSSWQPVAPEYLATVIERAEAVVSDAQALIAEIEEEQRLAAEAAAAPPDEEPKRGPMRPGTGLIIGGAAAMVVGVGGAGLGIGGLALGAQAQDDVENPIVYEPEHSAAEARGRRANVLAGVGFALAGVGVGVGVALIYLGVKKRKQSGGESEAEAQAGAMVVPSVGRSGAGLSVVGRF